MRYGTNMRKILYIHGMGGGSDSRIPSILSECLCSTHPNEVAVTVRTYDFDPEIAHEQITSWVDEIKPDMVIGESLGSMHALRIEGVPKIFVSPALNTHIYFKLLSWLTLIPGVTGIYDRIYRPREGDRQRLHFTPGVLRKYMAHRKAAMSAPVPESVYAFFGTKDHYRRSGIVSVRTWKRHFGDTFTIYDGTHFMEEEFVRSILLDKVFEVLNINK